MHCTGKAVGINHNCAMGCKLRATTNKGVPLTRTGFTPPFGPHVRNPDSRDCACGCRALEGPDKPLSRATRRAPETEGNTMPDINRIGANAGRRPYRRATIAEAAMMGGPAASAAQQGCSSRRSVVQQAVGSRRQVVGGQQSAVSSKRHTIGGQ